MRAVLVAVLMSTAAAQEAANDGDENPVVSGSVNTAQWQYQPTDTGSPCTALAQRCGQDNWKLVSITDQPDNQCAATTQQSPKALNFKTAEQKPYAKLEFTSNACAKPDFLVTEHTVEVSFTQNCADSYSMNHAGKEYKLTFFDYHSPSEHTIDGAYYPMEAQHVHKSATGEIAIVSQLMTVDSAFTSNSCPETVTSDECKRAKFFHEVLTLSTLKNSVGETYDHTRATFVNYEGTEAASDKTINNDAYNGFLKPLATNYFTYQGSDTVPPCTSGVTWLIMPKVVKIFDADLQAYRKITNAVATNQMWVTDSPWGTTSVPWTWNTKLGVANRALQPDRADGQLYNVGPEEEPEFPYYYLTEAAAAAVTTIEVNDITPFPAGTFVMIGSNLYNQEYNKVTAAKATATAAPAAEAAAEGEETARRLNTVVPGKLTLDTPLKNSHNKNAKVGVAASTTSTLTPWDSSASSSADQGSSGSLGSQNSGSGESDSSNSGESSGSYQSGSSESYMAVWKWLILALLGLVCCGAIIAAMMPKQKKAPKPKPEPVSEEPAPELEPLAPVVTTVQYQMPVTTAVQSAPIYSGGYTQVAAPTYAPVYNPQVAQVAPTYVV